MNVSPEEFAPFVVRLGGLETEQLDFFENALNEDFAEMLQLEQRLSIRRQDMVDICHEAIHGEENRDRRRNLLAIKRACFNNRPLTAVWPSAGHAADDAAVDLAECIVSLETELEEARGQWLNRIEAQHRREQEGLVGLLKDPAFRCGLAVANSDVAARLSTLITKPSKAYGRRDRRLLETLTRYASRAAYKTSPFSTFTWLGLGEVTVERPSGGLRRKDAGDLELNSLVRLRRHWLDRLQCLLLSYEPMLQTLPIELNDSLQSLADGRFRWMRPSRWKIDNEERSLSFEKEMVVRSRLQPELIQCLFELLSQGPLSFADLCRDLQSRFGEATPKAIRQLIDIGFLTPIWPWMIHQAHLEKEMLHRLREVPRTFEFGALLDCLGELVELQEGLLSSRHPDRDRERIATLMESMVELAAVAVDLEGYSVTKRWTRNDIYQDVWYGGDQTVVEIPKDSAARAIESIRPLLRYSRLFDLRLDFLYTLGSLLQERFATGTAIPFLEVCDLALPLRRDYAAFQKLPETDPSFSFNPRNLPVLDRLRQIRSGAPEVLASLCREIEEGQRVDEAGLTAWLDSLPARFTDPLAGPGLFLQPADQEGNLWMLNRLKEGTGRFNSRYTPVMSEASRKQYLQGWQSRSWWQVEGERAQYLDIQCICGDTLNVHEPQTAITLLQPGQKAALCDSKQRSLSDLFVHVGADGWPILRDGTGQRCIPVHLGGGFDAYMPLFSRLLCSFGPSEVTARLPPYMDRKVDGVILTGRTILGNLVLHRRAWSFDTCELSKAVAGASLSERFEAVQRWRQELALPRRGFVFEPVNHAVAGITYPPQYLDFDSPIFINLFCGMLKEERLTLVEMLPSPDTFPADSNGRHRVLEILLDDAILNPTASTASDEQAAESPIFNLSMNRDSRQVNAHA